MERFARWLWRRWRRRVFAGIVVISVAMSVIIVVTPALVVVAVVFEASAGQTALTFATVLPVSIVALSGGLVLLMRPQFEPVRRWGRGDTSDPTGAWIALVDVPRRATPALFALMTPPLFGLVAWITFVVLDDSWAAFVAVCIGALGVMLASNITVIISLDLLTRPIREEIDEHLPAGVETSTLFGLRSRIAAGMAAVAWATGFFTATTALQFDSHAGQFGASAVASFGFSALVVLGIARPTLVDPVLRPLDDLIHGTARVRAGDYAQHLPRTSDDDLGDLVASFNEMQRGLLERERLNAAFGSYVDPALAKRLLAQGDDLFAGEEVEVTVFFADVRDFTPYAEQATPREAVERLNALFELIVPVLHDHRGHANKFLGDGVLAVFGVPEPSDCHADDAVAAACEIQKLVRSTFGTSLRVGIGINTGRVIAGTIGGGGKLEFTLIGDAVNVAARVEHATKDTGDGILLTQATLDAITDGALPVEPRGDRELKGKAAPTALYALSS